MVFRVSCLPCRTGVLRNASQRSRCCQMGLLHAAKCGNMLLNAVKCFDSSRAFGENAFSVRLAPCCRIKLGAFDCREPLQPLTLAGNRFLRVPPTAASSRHFCRHRTPSQIRR